MSSLRLITSPVTRATTRASSRRRATLAAVIGAALALPLLVASPAAAEVPEGWSEPTSVPVLEALLILGAIPLALGLAITLLIYVPAVARGERIAPGAPAIENQWLGGPRKSAGELAAPDTEDSQAGGASARW